MKQKLLLLLVLFAFGLNAQTIYVKQNATGTGDGSSWANAYTSLDVALTAAASSTTASIWVAAGTYKSASAAAEYSFLLTSGNSMYGGFAGTETALNQRNIAANPTILSGDILGDDTPGNFTANRTDNAKHVLIVFVQSTNTLSIVDGFSIRNGQTLSGATNPDESRRGAGILTIAKITVRNCEFSANSAESGAGFCAFDAFADGSTIENCVFNANNATEDGICYFRNIPTGSVLNTTFSNNKTKRGCLYLLAATNITVDGCIFDRNLTKGTTASPNFGSGMFTWQSTFTLSNSTFRNNRADNGGGIYIDGRDGGDIATIHNVLFENDTTGNLGGGLYSFQATMDMKNVTFRNNYAVNAAGMFANGSEFDSSINMDSCTFEGNVVTSYGGSGFYASRANYTLTNSKFLNNVAPSAAAAIYHTDNVKFNVKSCLFEGNKAPFAGAIANFGVGCVGTFDACTFRANQATSGGGAVINGFKSDVTYKDCHFDANLGNYGAAIFTQNDTTRLTITGCLFENNVAAGTSGNGGAILVNTNIATKITNTTFANNQGSTGGAISANGDSLIIIDKCIFHDNIATTQGAAVNFNHVNAEITNTLFAKNLNTGTGAGGAISSNASDNELSKVKAVNCTFADNFAAIGAGIAQWESALGNSELHLLNCLLQNLDGGENYSIEDGAPDVFTLGGNQSNDASLDAYLTGTNDLNSTTNTFQNPDANNYAHTIDSPASDGGVAAGAPADDIIGIPRYSTPDVGYREVKVTVGVHNVNVEVLSLQCVPNPASDLTVINLNNNRNGQVQIAVWNQMGQLVAKYTAEKSGNEFSFPMNVSQLAAGTYSVQVQVGNVLHEGAFAKF